MDFTNFNPIVQLCDLRLNCKELDNMGARMSLLSTNLKMMYGNQVQEQSEEEDASYEVKEVQTPKKRIVKILDVNPKDSKSAETDSEDSGSEDPDYKDSGSEEDPDYKDEIVKNKRSIKMEPVTATVKPKVKKNLSAYEQMILKNREEKMAFLQSIKIEEAKLDFAKSIEQKKKNTIPVKRKFKEQTSPPVLRKSKRLASIPGQYLSEYYSTKRVIPPMMTYKEALNEDDLYESFVADLAIQESKCDTKYITYDMSDLKNLTVTESNVKITHSGITTLTWYPSPEQLIVAAADKSGNLGLFNVSNGSSPYLMRIHEGGITNMQFSPFNQVQLISSSYDGILRCGDMVQHKFNEIYNASDTTSCTYFDILTGTTFLVAQKNGHVAVIDSRFNGKSFEKKHACHDYFVKTVNIHPVNRNVFVSADYRGLIRLWDLRKLQKKPVDETDYHKRCVRAAYFSPVTGNSILATSVDHKISIFDCSNLSKMKLKQCMQRKSISATPTFTATWLPYSDESFVIGSMDYPRRVEVYDKNMFVYNIMHENFVTVTSVNVFHPRRHALAGGTSTGRIYVFT